MYVYIHIYVYISYIRINLFVHPKGQTVSPLAAESSRPFHWQVMAHPVQLLL